MTNVLKNQAAKTQKTRIVSAMADALQYLKTLVSRGVSTAQHHPSPGCYEDTLNFCLLSWGIGCSLTQYGGNRFG